MQCEAGNVLHSIKTRRVAAAARYRRLLGIAIVVILLRVVQGRRL
jgi:hypothetical protein